MAVTYFGARFFVSNDDDSTPTPKSEGKQSPQVQAQAQKEPIKELSPAPPPPIKKTTILKAVETNLPLQLIGTLLLKNESQSLCSLWHRKLSTGHPFFNGETAFQTLKITEIQSEMIIFKNLDSGRLEYLILAPMKIVKGKAGGRKRLVPLTKKDQITDFVIKRSDINKCMKNPMACLKQIAATPHYRNEVQIGWRLSNIKKGSLFDNIGLVSGDVIISANGESVTNMMVLMGWFNEIGSVRSVDLGIERDGRVIKRTYEVQ